MLMSKKKIEQRETIKLKLQMVDIEMSTLGMYAIKLRKKEFLVPDELEHFCSLAFKYKDELADDVNSTFRDKCFENDKLIPGARLNYYAGRIYHDQKLSKDEQKDLEELYRNDMAKIRKLIIRAVTKSGQNKFEKAVVEHREIINRMISECLHFKTGILKMSSLSIWWDKERMLHIFTAHVEESFLEYYNKPDKPKKTLFVHGPDEIRLLIERVLEKYNSEIQAHFKSDPNSLFVRKGRMAIEYDDDKYAIRIDINGKLTMFHRLEVSQ